MKLPAQPPSLPTAVQSMEANAGSIALIEALLKYPERIIASLRERPQPSIILSLLGLALFGMAIYGIVVGSLVGGTQMLIAPAKLSLGTLISIMICLPSLYIFTCLGGIDAHVRTVAGVLFAGVCLNSLLLIGFAPVAWIFSQSTDSIAFMGVVHLFFWSIGLVFGLRLIGKLPGLIDPKNNSGHLRVWSCIFTLVCLQMTATLRPIIGHSENFLPREKRFFLTLWLDSLGDKTSANP